MQLTLKHGDAKGKENSHDPVLDIAGKRLLKRVRKEAQDEVDMEEEDRGANSPKPSKSNGIGLPQEKEKKKTEKDSSGVEGSKGHEEDPKSICDRDLVVRAITLP